MLEMRHDENKIPHLHCLAFVSNRKNLSFSSALPYFLAVCCIAGCTGSGRLNATLVFEPISAVVFIAFYPKFAAW
jgi:hypothetical protein